MLQIEYPASAAEIESGLQQTSKEIQVQKPPHWVRLWVNRQKQAENDMSQLYDAVMDNASRATNAFQQIEAHYGRLYAGTKYLYELVEGNKQVSKDNLDAEISAVAESHEAFTTEVRRMITTNTIGKDARARAKRAEVQHIKDAVNFVHQINGARGREETTFRSNLSQWARIQDAAVATLQDQLAQALKELKEQKEASQLQSQRIQELEAAMDEEDSIPSVGSPMAAPYPGGQEDARPTDRNTLPVKGHRSRAIWRPRSGATRTSTTSTASTAIAIGAATISKRERRSRAAATASGKPGGRPPIATTRIVPGSDQGTPRAPRNPWGPSPPPPPAPSGLTMTHEMLVNILAGVRRQEDRPRRPAPIKLAQPAPYDGEKTTKFRSWWQAVEAFLRFHWDTQDYEKILFVGSRLEKNALEWHQARERRLGDAGTWAAYSQEIQECFADRRVKYIW